MAAIGDIIARANGTAGAWRVQRMQWTPVEGETVEVAALYHYGTEMLVWRVDNPADADWLKMATGWGSVSDQNGMNIAFRILGLPYSFRRAGGAEIVRNDAAPGAGYSRFSRSRDGYRRITYTYNPA